MRAEKFSAIVLDGHKGLAFELPFSPADRWGIAEVSLWPGRRGYRVRGSVNKYPFESVVVPRSKRFWVLVTDEMQQATGLQAGETVAVLIGPADA